MDPTLERVASAEDPFQMLLSLHIWLKAQANKKMTKWQFKLVILQHRQPYIENNQIKSGGNCKILKTCRYGRQIVSFGFIFVGASVWNVGTSNVQYISVKRKFTTRVPLERKV